MDKRWYRSLFRRSSMLRKLLLSIVFLICAPLILIQIFSVQTSTQEFTQAQHTQTLSFMQSMNAAFDEHIDAFSAYCIKIADAVELKYPLQPEVSGYELYTAASKLKEYDAVYPLIQYVGVYYPSVDRVICNGYCYKLAEFTDLYYGRSDRGNGALGAFLSSMEGTAFFSTGQ